MYRPVSQLPFCGRCSDVWLGGFAPEAGSEQGSSWEEREEHCEGCLLWDIGGYIRVTCLYSLKSNQARPPGARPPPPGGEDLMEAPFLPGGPTPCENKGFPGGSAGKESACNAGNLGSIYPWVGKIPWRRERLPIPVFWRGVTKKGHKELDTTERLSLHFPQGCCRASPQEGDTAQWEEEIGWCLVKG